MKPPLPATPLRRRLLDALPYAALVIYVAMTAILIPRHELWRDESADWLFTRWGTSLSAVLHDLGYQMDPGGWHTALYFLAKAFPNPLTMQVFHSLMAIAGVFLFIRFSPFPPLEKILYPFGYFVFFEYNIIVRNYVPISMFLALVATVYGHRFRRPWIYMLPLIGLVQTHLFGIFFAGTLTLLYLAELAWQNRTHWAGYRRYVGPILLLGAVSLVSFYQLFPSPDVRDIFSGVGGDVFQTTRGVILRWILPLVKPRFYFWPVSTVSDSHSTFLALLFVAVILYLVYPRPIPLLYFLTTGGIFMHSLVFRASGTRYIGMLYILLIFTLWLQYYYPLSARQSSSRWQQVYYPRGRRILLIVVLLLQMVGSPTAFWYDFRYLFSGGKQTAHFLNSTLTSTNVLIGTWLSYAAQSIQPYLRDDIPAFFNVEQEVYSRGLICDAKWWQNDKKFGPDVALRRLLRQAAQKKFDRVFLITIAPIFAPGESLLRLLGIFPSDRMVLCGDEVFLVYEVRPGAYSLTP